MRKNAFTLAEVLITLGIIGVVAALTIPSLMSNYRKRAVETKLQKFYTVINHAVKMSEVEHGETKDWVVTDCGGIDCLDYFNEHLGKYLKTTRVKYWDDDKSYIQADFADGSFFIIKLSMADMFFYPDAKKYLFEEFGTASMRHGMGKAYFNFRFAAGDTAASNIHHYNRGVEPYKRFLPEDYTREDFFSGGTAIYRCIESANNRSYCTALIQHNDWKIPDDYPFKF